MYLIVLKFFALNNFLLSSVASRLPQFTTAKEKQQFASVME
jgi:hypothetical protein